MKETVTLVKSDGRRLQFKALVTASSVMTEDAKLPVEEGDTLERSLPNGLLEKYIVQDRGFHERFAGIAAHYQMKVNKVSSLKTKAAANSNVINNYNLHGAQARVNISSTDSSVNVQTVTGEKLFLDLRETINTNVANETQRASMLTAVDKMQKATGSPTFMQTYRHFIAIAADHMTLLAPFIPALSQMLIS